MQPMEAIAIPAWFMCWKPYPIISISVRHRRRRLPLMSKETVKPERWRVWSKDDHYGEVLYKRAIGEFPEMESSKALAKTVKGIFHPGESLLDVGCGAGHYLRSLRREIGPDILYTG